MPFETFCYFGKCRITATDSLIRLKDFKIERIGKGKSPEIPVRPTQSVKDFRTDRIENGKYPEIPVCRT